MNWRCLCLTLVVAAEAHAGPPDESRQQVLMQLLKDDCGACHGMNLNGGLGPALLPESLAGKDDDMLVATILNGRAETPMPAWRDFINADEAAWLVQYLRKDVGLKQASP